jgi:hypothetical protein
MHNELTRRKLLAKEEKTRRVWPVAMGWRVGTSGWSFHRRGLHQCRENGTLRCQAGASLNFGRSASRERFYESVPSISPTRPIVYDVLSESSVSTQGPKAILLVAKVGSVVSCLHLPLLSAGLSGSDRCAGWMWQVERFAALGVPDFRGQHVEVLPLGSIQQRTSPPSRPPRAVRSHQSFRWHDRLARNAWSGPPPWHVTLAGVPAFLASN